MAQDSVLFPILYNLLINYTFQTPGAYLALFADDSSIYPTDRKEHYVIRKLQRGLSSMESWRERWNIKPTKISQPIYFSRGNGPAETHLTLNRRNIPFANQVRYLDVFCGKRVTLTYHSAMIEDKVFRKFITVYSLFNYEQLGGNLKLTLQTAIIKTVKIYTCPASMHTLKL